MDRSSLQLSERIVRALLRVAEKNTRKIYIAGGAVRNFMIGRESFDLDLTIPDSAMAFAGMLQAELGGGTLVDLTSHGDEAVRVVFKGQQVDISSFRGGARTVEQDLLLRDFSINAMAVPLRQVLFGEKPALIDPAGGREDLRQHLVVGLPGAFVNDPLRMLRGFRFCAELGFHLESGTMEEIRLHAPLVATVAAERVQAELNKIFASPRAWATLKKMDEAGILGYILPELYLCKDVEQPDFHHLDVFDHCFQCLREMEGIIAGPGDHFTEHLELIRTYLNRENIQVSLKYSALLHDLGKPCSRGHGAADPERVTFHGHDTMGKAVSLEISRRLRFSREFATRVGGLVGMHMHPFHLCNVQRGGRVSNKAVMKLCRRAGEDLVGLFLLAMADSLASRGRLKPERMEAELVELFGRVVQVYLELVQPVLSGPRLVTGSDLMREFRLNPGPFIGELLEGIDDARVEGKVQDREQALGWAKEYMERAGYGDPG
jgi:poly(A) polymerase